MQDLEAAGHVSSPIVKERVVNAYIVSSLYLSVPPRIPLKEQPHPQYTDLPNLLNAIKIIPQSFPMACLTLNSIKLTVPNIANTYMTLCIQIKSRTHV